MFQIRGSDGKAYRPGRDISYLFPDIAQAAAFRLCKDSWHEVTRDYAQFSGLKEADLAKGTAALAQFCNMVCNIGYKDIGTAWMNSGLGSLPKPVLMAIMFELGVGFTAAWYNAVRETTQAGQAAPGAYKMGDLAEKIKHTMDIDLPSARSKAEYELQQEVCGAD